MKQPNVILIAADQLRAFEVGCYGGTVQTPHLDRLAEEGVRFDLALSNQPTCGPAACCLLTGRYCRPAAAAPRPAGATIAQVLRAAGYRTGFVGRWHLAGDPREAGFESAVVISAERRHCGQTYLRDGRSETIRPFAPLWELERAVEFLSREDSRPFFLLWSLSLPHGPFAPRQAPQRYVRMYDPASVELRVNASRNQRPARNPEGGPGLPRLLAYYAGAVTCLDERVGGLLEVLRERKAAPDTLVVFLSDHGNCLGSHGRFAAGGFYEEAVRVPMIFRLPHVAPPQENFRQAASLVDVLPTVLDLCGVPPPPGLAGQSLAPIVRRRRQVLGENVAFLDAGDGTIAARDADFLLALELEDGGRRVREGSELLFDLGEDPFQLHPLLASGRTANLVAPLRRRLVRWHEETLPPAPPTTAL